jgi:hypothetical protein
MPADTAFNTEIEDCDEVDDAEETVTKEDSKAVIIEIVAEGSPLRYPWATRLVTASNAVEQACKPVAVTTSSG